ncbi:hypothetical protein PWT90_10535 [Aphanocladium album]|nr:hypothetical protein PWT90_10535 [Aphanocladium album]
MATCVQIPVTIPADGTLSNATLHSIIATFLPQEWPSVDPSTLIVTHHTGYANTNCVVERPSTRTTTAVEPRKVFVKVNGELDGEIAVFKHLAPDKIQEAQLCQEYGRTGRGPRMYGFFQTQDGAYGRVDEFLEARNLTARDVEDESVREDVARAQAAFHAMKTTRERRPVEEYYAALTGALERYRGMDKLKKLGGGVGVNIDDIIDYNFVSRIRRITSRLDAIGAKKGWCIHDVQYMNTMLRASSSLLPGQHRAVLIDYEFVFCNYRGVDIGGHFLHKLFRWFDDDSKLTRARPYAEDEKRHYCGVYAAQWREETGEDDDEGSKVLEEAELGYMLAIAFEVHNMYNFMVEEGEEDEKELEALRVLFAEFVRQYEGLGLEE